MGQRILSFFTDAYVLLFIVLTGLFLVTRFHGIADSLLFYNDMGRDFLVLLNWQETGKPPLLGPQTSALPLNQSAVYFYLLYPLFVLTNQSFYATLYTNAMLYLSGFIASFWLAKTRPLKIAVLVVFFLLIIHPHVIGQNRFIWNPSFLPPLLVLSFVALFRLLVRWSLRLLIVHAASVTLAIALSFSLAPLFIALAIALVIFVPRKSLWFITSYVVGLIFWNLPTIAFELRHSFLLTKVLLTGNFLSQPRTGFIDKLSDVMRYVGGVDSTLGSIIVIAVITLCLAALITQQVKLRQQREGLLLSVFLLTLVLTFVAKVRIEKHYIFGLLIPACFLIAFLPPKLRNTAIILLTIVWVTPTNIARYLQPAPRSTTAMNRCAAAVCSMEREPMFVSLQSDLLTFHAGPEYQYLLKRNSCDVKQIEKEPQAAQTMAVVVDQSNYDHGKTSYHELSLFGPSKETRVYHCPQDIQVHMLER